MLIDQVNVDQQNGEDQSFCWWSQIPRLLQMVRRVTGLKLK